MATETTYGDDADDGDDDRPAPVVSPDDQKVIDEMLERYSYASTQWADIIAQADIDVAYAAGDTWTKDDRTDRKGRPILNLDQLSQYTNQLVNSFRQNPRAAKVSPAGNGATDETAALHANRIRQIEHDSHAQEVYTVAGENMATRGYGFARIVADYEDSTSDNQTLRLEAIPNPNQVLPDPDGKSTSGRDWKYLFFVDSITKTEFTRDYPDAQIKDFTPDVVALAPTWFGKQGRIQIVEYWTVTESAPAGGRGRPVPHVCQYISNGVELLHRVGRPTKTEWKGSTIPFASAYGKIIYKTDEGGCAQKELQSYIRLARDGAKAYNWTASTKMEVLALPVKAALFAYEGQLDNDNVALVERSTKEPIALITAKATTEATGQAVLPLPQYGTRAPDIQGYEIAGESFRRDIQNALGRYSVQDHRLGSTKVTSGVALRELDKSGDLGSYHFVAHYDDMIRELARKLDELLPFYDDTEKEIDTREPDGSTTRVWINRKTGRAQNGTAAWAPTDLRMDVGRHIVSISTGPAADREREANSDFADHVIDSPQILEVVGPQKAAALIALAMKLKGAGAIGDQMAEIVDPKKKPGGQPDPRQLQQQLAEQGQQLKHAEAVMQALDDQLKTKALELASKERIAGSQARLAVTIQRMKDATAIANAKIVALTKGVISDGEAQLEQIALDQDAALTLIQHEHERDEAHQERQHQAEQARQQQQHQAGMAAAGVGAAADAQDVGHAQALELGQQQADLAPAPDAGGGAE